MPTDNPFINIFMVAIKMERRYIQGHVNVLVSPLYKHCYELYRPE